jgi:hypothetical protein
VFKGIGRFFSGAALALVSGWASAHVISFAGPTEIDAGDPLTLSIVLQPGSGGLLSADVGLTYDPSKVSFASVSLGSLLTGRDWTDPFATSFPDSGTPTLNLLLASTLANVDGLAPESPAGEIFRISFDVLAAAGSSLTFAFPSGVSLLGIGSGMVAPDPGAPLMVRVRAPADGTPLPEPSSVLLAGTVLLLGAAFASRRRRPDNQ